MELKKYTYATHHVGRKPLKLTLIYQILANASLTGQNNEPVCEETPQTLTSLVLHSILYWLPAASSLNRAS